MLQFTTTTYYASLLHKQDSQGPSRWPRYYPTVKTVQLNPIGLILFNSHQDGLGRPSHTRCSRASLAVRFRQMNFNYRSCSSCTRTIQSASSRGTHYYVNAEYVQSWYSDLLNSQKDTPPSDGNHLPKRNAVDTEHNTSHCGQQTTSGHSPAGTSDPEGNSLSTPLRWINLNPEIHLIFSWWPAKRQQIKVPLQIH